MSSQELRLKCLELVLTHLDIRDPEEFYNFVIPDEVYKRETNSPIMELLKTLNSKHAL
jgi:hypothetical protein